MLFLAENANFVEKLGLEDRMAANAPTEIRSLLKDVALEGAKLVNKKKLLWMLGWGQTRPNTWTDLLDFWEEVGGARDTLYGAEIWGSYILLTLATPDTLESVTKWEG